MLCLINTQNTHFKSLERYSKNPQRTFPCPITGLCPDPSSPEAGKGAVAPFLSKRIIREPYVKRLSRHILTLRAPVFHGPLDNGSAPLLT